MSTRLPENLSSLAPENLDSAKQDRDELLTPLFRRWPELDKLELAKLHRLYDERLRLAKHVGARRKRPANCTREENVMTSTSLWMYRETVVSSGLDTTDIVGYGVEALDGSIGKVDEATYDAGSAYIVVDTGPWIFGKKVMLPAGVAQEVDAENEIVYVNRTKDQIKNAPEYDESKNADETYRTNLGSYYGPGGAGYRD